MMNSGAPTSARIYHVYSQTPFDDIINGVLADPTPPSVLSFSYGGAEQYQTNIPYTNTKFQMLGLSGVTVFVSSGDTGAYLPNGMALSNICFNGFNPSQCTIDTAN